MAASAPPPARESFVSRPMVIGLAGGSGLALATAVMQIMRPEARPITDAVIHWGPLFVIVLLGMELLHSTVNTWGGRFVTAATANAVAMQSMADAMQRISQREDERERERELAADHLAYTAQQILKTVEALNEKFDSLDGKVQSIQVNGCSKAAHCGPEAGGSGNG